MSYFNQVRQDVQIDPTNSSSTNLDSGAYYVGKATSTLGVAGLQVSLKTSQNCSVYIDQSPGLEAKVGTVSTNGTVTLTGDGTKFLSLAVGDEIYVQNETVRTIATISSDTVLTVTSAFSTTESGATYQAYDWDITDTFSYYASINNFGTTVQAINAFARVRVRNTGALTTTYFRVQFTLCPIAEVLPRSLDSEGHLRSHTYGIQDQNDFRVENTPIGEMRAISPNRLIGVAFDGSTVDTNFWTTYTSSSGSLAQNNARMELSTGTSTNGVAAIYSTKRARYVSGSANVFRTVLRLGDTGVTNNLRRWGIARVNNYTFTITSANIVAGDVYTNNSQQFIVLTTGTSQTTLYTNGTGAPAASGTLTKVSGTGPATLTFSDFSVACAPMDGAWFQMNGTTFEVVTTKANSQSVVSSGSFNGKLGAIYTPAATAAVFEIYWTNSKVIFTINGDTLHTFTAPTDTWSDTMNFYIYADNSNLNNSTSSVYLFIRVISIRRLGQIDTETSYKNITAATTTTLKYSPGRLRNISINQTNLNTGDVTIYDSIVAAGAIIGTIGIPKSASAVPATVSFDCPFHNGLTIVTSAACNITVVYE